MRSGNGGGFVFDARCLPNPGREEQFKPLTGKDDPVIEYLNQQESVHQFFSSAASLVDASVSSYQQRGFKSLMVSFGCTGGQHRSVFWPSRWRSICERTPALRWRCVTSSWKRWANEGDDSGSRAGDETAAADERSSQGAGGGGGADDARDYARTAAQLRGARGDCKCASFRRDDDRVSART